LTFILSFIPGLGQMYLGQVMRGWIFLLTTIGTFLGIFVLMEILFIHSAGVLFIIIPLIWLISLVDSMIIANRINNMDVEDGNEKRQVNSLELTKQNKKLIALAFSIIPGAGHMYLGLQRQGLQLMTMFFFILFFTDALRLSFLMFILPVIWFFGVFDTLKKVSDEGASKDEDIIFFSWINGDRHWEIGKNKILGYGLIILGLILIFNRVALPLIGQYISWTISNYLQTALIAFLFILGGIKLLLGSKEEKSGEKGEENGGSSLCESGE